MRERQSRLCSVSSVPPWFNFMPRQNRHPPAPDNGRSRAVSRPYLPSVQSGDAGELEVRRRAASARLVGTVGAFGDHMLQFEHHERGSELRHRKRARRGNRIDRQDGAAAETLEHPLFVRR